MMKIKYNNTIKLFLLMIGFVLFSILTVIMNAMGLWFLLIGILSVFYIWKYREKIKRKTVMIALLFSAIAMISNAFMGIFVFPTYLASSCIMSDTSNKIVLYHNKDNTNTFPMTLLSIFLIGGLLSILNLMAALDIYEPSISFTISYIFDAFRAGIFEEVFFRMFLFALCVEILPNNLQYTKVQNILCYIIMIIPHVLIHFSGTIYLENVIYLSLYGLPLSIMQRKINLISAIATHSLIDLVRFIVLGV